jgi:hypothetical protein
VRDVQETVYLDRSAVKRKTVVSRFLGNAKLPEVPTG